MITINGDRLLDDLRTLAKFGAFKTGVDRVAFSREDLEARRWLIDRMRQAGLDASLDRVGNILGRDPRASQSILVGSHTDTVPKGGWLDGALGVIYALEIARASIETGTKPAVGVDAISFQDEEGTYLSCFGCRTFCGDIDADEVEAARSKEGVMLTHALAGFAGEAALHRFDPKRQIGYLEAHIEQGPRLEGAGRRIAVVTGLVGIRRFRIRAAGRADHAGTTPMNMRQDAGATLIKFAGWVAGELPRHGGPETVWNIGSMSFLPGAANVVPSQAELVLEFRDTSADVLDLLEKLVLSYLKEPLAGGVTLSAEPISRIPPAQMSPKLGSAMADAAQACGETCMFIPSGAGHDAMFMARVTPSAMLFIPSIGGRSHDISENTSDADIVIGCKVLAGTVARLQNDPSAFGGG